MGRVCGNIKGSEAVTTVGIERYPLFTRDSMLCVCVFSDLFARRIAQQDPLLLLSPSCSTARKTADWQSDLQ